MYLAASTGTSGAAAADAQGYMLKFEASEREDFFEVTNALGLLLTTAG
jgi:hypothetical protein